MEPRVKIMLKPVGRGHEVVGFIPAGVSYTAPEPTTPAQQLLANVCRIVLGAA
jgi:hypothetical protein